MSSIEQIVQQIEFEIQINEQGQGKATIRAVARLADVSPEAISKALLSVNHSPSKLATILMERGFEAVNLTDWAETGIPDIAIAVILKYYGYQAGRYCTKQARDADNVFSAIGIRAWMQKLKGWQEPQLTTQQPAIALLSPKEEIEIIDRMNNLLEKFCGGQLEARDRLALADATRNVLHKLTGTAQAQTALPVAQEITISERAMQLGYRVDNGQLKSIGRKASILYQAKHGEKPSERRQWVDGAPRSVKSYTSADLDIVDAAIKDSLNR